MTITENSYVLSEYEKMMLPPLTFMIDPTMNLMNGPHHECEKREHHCPYSKIT